MICQIALDKLLAALNYKVSRLSLMPVFSRRPSNPPLFPLPKRNSSTGARLLKAMLAPVARRHVHQRSPYRKSVMGRFGTVDLVCHSLRPNKLARHLFYSSANEVEMLIALNGFRLLEPFKGPHLRRELQRAHSDFWPHRG